MSGDCHSGVTKIYYSQVERKDVRRYWNAVLHGPCSLPYDLRNSAHRVFFPHDSGEAAFKERDLTCCQSFHPVLLLTAPVSAGHGCNVTYELAIPATTKLAVASLVATGIL
jgi:hypothetical protein